MRNKAKSVIAPLLFLGALIFLLGSCKKDDDNNVIKQILVLSTTEVTKIGQITALSGGVITSNAGFAVTARGVCWNTTGDPTVADTKTTDGLGAGSFTSKITGLTVGTTYYLRAYVTNSEGTVYGNTVIFETLGSTFTDSRDGNVYRMVTIGDQIWMAENLRYLPSVVGPGTGSLSTPYYYVYGYDGTVAADAKATDNYTTYGVLYNWPAAMAGSASSTTNPSGVQGVCPTGWHLPSDAEWTQMVNYLADNDHNYDGTTGGGAAKIAKSLASTSGWNSSSITGAVGNTDYPAYRNKSGFTALPGGVRSIDGTFLSIGSSSDWWSTTEYNATFARRRHVYYHYRDVINSAKGNEWGISVRCVRDLK